MGYSFSMTNPSHPPGDAAARIASLEREIDRLRAAADEGAWLFQHTPALVCILGEGAIVKRANPAFWRTLGLPDNALLGQSIKHLMHPDEFVKSFAERMKLLTGEDSRNFELRHRHADGSWRWISWSCPAIRMAEPALFLVGHDVTESRLSAAELLHRAQHDPLTGLENRAMLDHSLAQALLRHERHPAQDVALMLIDLDGFKQVNDTFGHAAGDDVLRHVAAALKACQRKSDLVCRVGGDEFALIAEGAAQPDLESIAGRIVTELSMPIQWEGHDICIGASIGIALAGGKENAADLYRQADAALYAVKRGGKNGYAVAPAQSR